MWKDPIGPILSLIAVVDYQSNSLNTPQGLEAQTLGIDISIYRRWYTW
jgi:hypothetical protein